MNPSRHPPDDSSRARAAAEAAAWVLRCDRKLTAEEQDDFSSWLAASAQHRAELARMRQHWRRLDAIAGWRPQHTVSPNPDLLKPRSRAANHNLIPVAAAIAALAAIVVLGIGMSGRPRTSAIRNSAGPVILSATESLRRLEDGTIVELNRGADVQVDFTGSERRVRLLRGEAHFAVKKNAARPFIVEVGRVAVRAVGTAFNIRFAPAEVEVLVTEGSVTVADGPADASGRADSPNELAPLIPSLAVRQRAVISLAPHHPTPQIATLTPGEIERVLSWQDRMLDFTATALADVIREFNRRNVVQLVLEDQALAATRISATFRADNLEGFVHLLEAGFGANVERRGDEIIVRKAP